MRTLWIRTIFWPIKTRIGKQVSPNIQNPSVRWRLNNLEIGIGINRNRVTILWEWNIQLFSYFNQIIVFFRVNFWVWQFETDDKNNDFSEFQEVFMWEHFLRLLMFFTLSNTSPIFWRIENQQIIEQIPHVYRVCPTMLMENFPKKMLCNNGEQLSERVYYNKYLSIIMNLLTI